MNLFKTRRAARIRARLKETSGRLTAAANANPAITDWKPVQTILASCEPSISAHYPKQHDKFAEMSEAPADAKEYPEHAKALAAMLDALASEDVEVLLPATSLTRFVNHRATQMVAKYVAAPIVGLAIGVSAGAGATHEGGSEVDGPRWHLPWQGHERTCIEKSEHLPYALLSATMFVEVSDEMGGPVPVRRMRFRTFYTLRANRAIRSGEHTFHEEYSATHALGVLPWAGSDEMIPRGGGDGIYDVLFDLPQGAFRTIATGADLRYQLPLGDHRSAFDGTVTVGPTDDFVSYPNATDHICELSVVVSSASPQLQLRGVGSWAHRVRNGSVAHDDGQQFEVSEDGLTTLAARWRDVEPDDEVGIVFSWPRPVETAPPAPPTPTTTPPRVERGHH